MSQENNLIPMSEVMTAMPRLFQENTRLKQFRDRYEQEEKERKMNLAFDGIMHFARVVSSMPEYIKEIRLRPISIDEKEKHIRMVIDLMESVRQAELKKFNELIYSANVKPANFF